MEYTKIKQILVLWFRRPDNSIDGDDAWKIVMKDSTIYGSLS